MGSFLLSYLSPETLSWTGFIVLAIALVGEAGIALTTFSKEGRLHKELAFIFAIAAAAGYAIERVGDDAILNELRTRAAQAEQQLKKFFPRDLTSPDQKFIADAVRGFAGQRFEGSVSPGVDDGCSFWATLNAALEQGEWVNVPLAANVIKTCASLAGVPGVAVRIHVAKQTALLPAATALVNALHDKHIKAAIEPLGNDQNDEVNNIISIAIGARVPVE
jgi:hypothetical protein